MSDLSKKKSGSAQGLNALLNIGNAVSSAHTMQKISVDVIISNRFQPRLHFEESELNELVMSIKENGLLQPIVVRKIKKYESGSYEIVAGERRWMATKRLEKKEINCIVIDISDEKLMTLALIENIQRSNLSAWEQAIAIKRLQTKFSLSHDNIAKRISKSRPMVTNLLRILDLPKVVQDLLKCGKIEFGHAKILAGLDDSDIQVNLAEKIVKDALSVRSAEAMVKQLKATKKSKKRSVVFYSKEKLSFLYEEFSHLMPHTDVKIKLNEAGEGTVTFCIDIPEQVNELIEGLKLLRTSRTKKH